ncbi:MAG: hypothetical protein E7I47_10600 [Clostridium sp.]|uniref:hypothetical protein n=1 Tax=Clostridium sp. TaxID=1506 RepID=UPI00290DFFD5|nr:hypothetical protein [Clostridium sp.]MDU4319747.1 hypothetical protein [Clostridium sp.]
MKITTQQCISIITFINKMGIYGKLIESVKKITRTSLDEEILNRNIADKLGDKKLDLTEVAKFLMNNPEIAEKKNKLKEEQDGMLFEIVFTIIEGIPKAETQFYKTIADIKGTDVETVKNADASETVEFIKEIINSETFMGFFKFSMK